MNKIGSNSLTSDDSKDISRIVITICTYNESENLSRLIQEIHAVLPVADILVVDDDSPDGTGKIADQLAAQNQRVRVLHRVGERGLGTATLKAFQHSIDAGYELLVNLDADFSHHPRYIPDMLHLLQEPQNDVVIGSRYVPGGKIMGWAWKRHFMSRCVNVWSRFWLGLKTRDCSGSYRCYRCSMLKKVDLSHFRSRGYSVQEELLFRCVRVGAKFIETPIVFEDRKAGESKINWREAIIAVFVIMRCGLERKKK